MLASSLQEIIFLSENPNKLCDRLRLLIQKKQAGNDTNKFDSEIIVIVDETIHYKCITLTQHKMLRRNVSKTPIELSSNKRSS